jgi:hypothetical protein
MGYWYVLCHSISFPFIHSFIHQLLDLSVTQLIISSPLCHGTTTSLILSSPTQSPPNPNHHPLRLPLHRTTRTPQTADIFHAIPSRRHRRPRRPVRLLRHIINFQRPILKVHRLHRRTTAIATIIRDRLHGHETKSIRQRCIHRRIRPHDINSKRLERDARRAVPEEQRGRLVDGAFDDEGVECYFSGAGAGGLGADVEGLLDVEGEGGDLDGVGEGGGFVGGGEDGGTGLGEDRYYGHGLEGMMR